MSSAVVKVQGKEDKQAVIADLRARIRSLDGGRAGRDLAQVERLRPMSGGEESRGAAADRFEQSNSRTSRATAGDAARLRTEVLSGAALSAAPWLDRHLQAQGMPRAAATSMSACPSAITDIVAHATGAGSTAAIVGCPDLAIAAVAAAGGDLERLILVPDPAPHAVAVLGTLVESLDLVLYHHHELSISPTFARPVDARLRRGRCALVSLGVTWPHSTLHIELALSGVNGLGRGSGRISGVELSGRVWGRAQPPTTLHSVILSDAAEALPASESAMEAPGQGATEQVWA